LLEDREIFNSESHSAGDWLSRFQVWRLANLGSRDSLRPRMDAGIQREVRLREYAKTPAKRGCMGDKEEADKSPSWREVECEEGKGFEDIWS
jgi:hypothetical protein